MSVVPHALDYQSKQRSGGTHGVPVEGRMRSLYVPLAVAVVGIAMLTPRFADGDFSAFGLGSIGTLAFVLAWNVGVMLGALWLMCLWTKSGLGVWWSVLLKLLAIIAASFGLGSIIMGATDGVSGWFLGYAACVVAYWVLSAIFFELDPQEMLQYCLFTTATRWLSYLMFLMTCGWSYVDWCC